MQFKVIKTKLIQEETNSTVRAGIKAVKLKRRKLAERYCGPHTDYVKMAPMAIHECFTGNILAPTTE